MWGALLLLGVDETAGRPEPETTVDYIFLYTGLGLVLLAVLFLALRSWRNRRELRSWRNRRR